MRLALFTKEVVMFTYIALSAVAASFFTYYRLVFTRP